MEKVIIENMDGVLICEVPINAVLENDSKKIKLSTEKLANVLSKALLPKENIKIEEPIHEEIDDKESIKFITDIGVEKIHDHEYMEGIVVFQVQCQILKV